MRCPPIAPVLVIADDAKIAAHISCSFARARRYLPIIEGPRLWRPDREAEIIRRKNVSVRAKSRFIVFGGLSDDAAIAMAERFPSRQILHFKSESEVKRVQASETQQGGSLAWGRDRIGVGLLKALRNKQTITFSTDHSPLENVQSRSGHFVVCEAGTDLSEVIAANYAFALDAGLTVIPEIEERIADDILERFYNLNETPDQSPTNLLESLKSRIVQLTGQLQIPSRGSVTFFTNKLPFGFAFPNLPSTHLFNYPDVGLTVINGFAAEQPSSRGIGWAIVVDPGATPAPEIVTTAEILAEKGAIVRGYRGASADVTSVSNAIELFPYDFLMIATHCGDPSGYRWTYEFRDSEGHDRTLVVDIAIGVGRTNDNNLLHVTEFMRFAALDGIDWLDPNKMEKLYVGSAINDFMDLRSAKPPLEPTKKERVRRVVGSSALKMADNNYIAVPRSLACEGTPIIFNNACGSWHRLAETFTFTNARAYIGTLFPVTTTEAQEIALRTIKKYGNKSLSGALWAAQRDVYGKSGIRRPYVVTGVYPQKIRAQSTGTSTYIAGQLASALSDWQRRLARMPEADSMRKSVESYVSYYERELAEFKLVWREHLRHKKEV